MGAFIDHICVDSGVTIESQEEGIRKEVQKGQQEQGRKIQISFMVQESQQGKAWFHSCRFIDLVVTFVVTLLDRNLSPAVPVPDPFYRLCPVAAFCTLSYYNIESKAWSGDSSQ